MTDQPPPVLDARNSDEIMASLAELSRESLPAWQPPPDGDAGTMLHRGFARLLELALLRLNQVPEKNFLAFLDTMGVSLLPPAPAHVPLTFTLAPGSAPTEVPAGTVAAARAQAGQPAVTFETDAPLTVVPAQLTAARTVDPVGDRYSDQGGFGPSGFVPSGFAPFTGTLAIAHALWLGTGSLLADGRAASVQVVLSFTSRRPAGDVARFLGALTFQYYSGGAVVTALPQLSQGTGAATFSFAVGPVDLTTVAAPGLTGPVPDRWLRTTLATPYPLDPVAQDLSVTGVTVTASGTGLMPDAAFAGSAPVDLSKDFRPFGDTPRVGDAFYLGSDRAFGSAGAQVTIAFAAGAGTASNVQLIWEYLGTGGWASLPAQVSAGFDLTRDGTVTIASMPALAAASVSGTASHWLRVRIASGGYGSPVQWVPTGSTVVPQAGTGNLSPPVLRSVSVSYSVTTTPTVLRQSGAVFSDQTAPASRPFPAYLPVSAITPAALADAQPAFYLGFDSLPAGYPVTVYVATAPRAFPGRVIRQPATGSGTATQSAPVAWDYFDGSAWQPLAVLDGTQDLTISGSLTLIVPADLAPLARFDLVARYWIRARSGRAVPADQRLLAGVFLNTVAATASATVSAEVIGSGTGQSAQVCQLAQPPVLPGQQVWVAEAEPPTAAELAVLVTEEGADAVTSRPDPATGQPQTWVRWHEVANFVCSGPADRHYTLDHLSGTVTFGDGRSGLIPPAGARNLTASYRTGGGPAGNATTGSVGQLRTPIPAVTAVTNPIDAGGGAVAETVPQVLSRGPQAVRNRHRAVGRGDFEWLARQAGGTSVARAVCLPNVNSELRFEPGWVTVVVIPQGGQSRLIPTVELLAEVESYLQDRASVGLVQQPGQQLPGRISVIGPGYLRVVVVAQIVPHDLSDAVGVKQRVSAALAGFLHPLTGGRAGTGWELGRDVYISEVAQIMEAVPGVSYVKSLRLVPSAVQRRLGLPAVPAPVLAADAPVASVVTTADRRKAALLSEPGASEALADHLTVRCLQEGDLVSVLLDLVVSATTGAATLTAVPVGWAGPGGFPVGCVVLSGDGRQARLVAAIGPVSSGNRDPITVQVDDPAFLAGLSAGRRITLVGPLALAITAAASQPAAAGQPPAVTMGVQPARTDLTLPAGTVLGTADGQIRLPLAAQAAPDPATGTITTLTLGDFQAGDQVVVLAGDGASQVLAASVAQAAPVDDLIYLDPNVFPYVTDHQIQMIGQ